jgi:hypothetical protein
MREEKRRADCLLLNNCMSNLPENDGMGKVTQMRATMPKETSCMTENGGGQQMEGVNET